MNDKAFQVVALACALVVTGLVVRREVFGSRRDPQNERPERISGWTALDNVGQRVGGGNDGLPVVVFSDFECPACRQFANYVLPAMLARFGDSVSVVLRHWPLPYHKAARPAAVFSECASRHIPFLIVHDSLFAVQASLDSLDYSALGERLGVSSVEALEECMQDPAVMAKVEDDAKRAEAIGGIGTPTLVIDGYRVQRGLDTAKVFQFIGSRMSARR